MWMGGVCGDEMIPGSIAKVHFSQASGVADWGIKEVMFFQDLSCRVTTTDEYSLANQILSEMNSVPIVILCFNFHANNHRHLVGTVTVCVFFLSLFT